MRAISWFSAGRQRRIRRARRQAHGQPQVSEETEAQDLPSNKAGFIHLSGETYVFLPKQEWNSDRLLYDATTEEEVVQAYRNARELLDQVDAETHLSAQLRFYRNKLARLLEQPLGREEIEAVAPTAEQTIEHTLARMFMRLGPPPEPTELDYTPAGSGGGGAQQ
ncbi:hypothetical protein ACWDA7_13255 [Streptomyces sp. NPDC001156]